MITEISGLCRWEGCEQTATHIACGRKRYDDDGGHPEPACYCKTHADVVADEGNPEYCDTCPNCDCMFGVN